MKKYTQNQLGTSAQMSFLKKKNNVAPSLLLAMSQYTQGNILQNNLEWPIQRITA